MDWEKTLEGILGSYFSDWSVEEGVSQLVMEAVDHPDAHNLYLSTFELGVVAAVQGDSRVVDIINVYCYAKDIKDALQFLERILNEYRHQYSAEMSKRLKSSSHQ